jgi:hypothetical protein
MTTKTLYPDPTDMIHCILFKRPISYPDSDSWLRVWDFAKKPQAVLIQPHLKFAARGLEILTTCIVSFLYDRHKSFTLCIVKRGAQEAVM